MTRLSELDLLIIGTWETNQLNDPDISVERLFEIVEDATGADFSQQLAALERAGIPVEGFP